MNGFADIVQHAIDAKKVSDTDRDTDNVSNAPISEQIMPDSDSAVAHGAHAIKSPKTPGRRHLKSESINRAESQDSSGSSPPPSHTQTTRSPHDSPSSRTGPPRSFSYTITRSPNLSRQNTRAAVEDDIEEEELPNGLDYGAGDESEGGYGFPVEAESDNAGTSGETRPGAGSRLHSSFRGALEYIDPEQREKEREAMEKREKNRMSKIAGEDSWINPLKWLNGDTAPPQESPQTDGEGWTSYFDFLKPGDKGKEKENTEDEGEAPNGVPSEKKPHKRIKGGSVSGHSPDRSASHDETEKAQESAGRKRIERSHSMPHMKRPSPKKTYTPKGAPRWNRLRSLIPSIAQQGRIDTRQGQIAVQPHVVNITDELIAGGLSALMLKLWFERDERGARRIPVLFHRLRVRISDSIHPLKGNKAVFRIECEYANGAVRWVVYRQLRDFVSLHTHYKLSNAFNRNVDALPEFPRTSLPYFKFLREKGKENEREIGRTDFAIMQREALENYLIGLIRAVMFHPTSNRLAGFLEISSLSIQLAQSGGWQAKAGLLTIEPASKKSGGFGRRSATWADKKKQRWCALRESYLVAVEDPAETTIWDVFLLDSDFKIERPKRYYRQGFHLLHSSSKGEELTRKRSINSSSRIDGETHSTLGKMRAKLLNFKVGHRRSRSSGHVQWSSQASGSMDRSRHHVRSQSGITSGSDSESDESEDEDRSPMEDPSTNIDPMRMSGRQDVDQANAPETDGEGDMDGVPDLEKMERQMQKKKGKKRKDVSKHTFFISNSQMRLKLYAKSERQMQQWITALERVAQSSYWTGSNRFGSFAPIRLNVAAQWLVDGRDYMWNLSRAIMLARERIYIHDWWLSPELQMRRPHMERYRLDQLLERKAKEGVKIYVILYQEVSNRTTPTDSNYTKQRLTALHPNILVQRSPSHFQTGTFYWAHHEKLCVIDEAIAFMGGVDLCFGRWDTPQHILIDDPDPEEEGSAQIWPGKDYSNARISDFFTLTKPFEDMYDRQKIPRMPWHDVGMHIVGQPARDLCRHFVQRWNYLLRIKNHSRTMPFLLPPPDFKSHELDEQGLTGTCEIQICRSCGPWSMGTSSRVESSIQNAYLKAIQMSDHFVYIENQFFITSTVVNDTVIENRIGDALVSRIIRAHREGTNWKACIMIPLLPGFPFPVDHSDASSVRIILECQNRTICRGPHSIYGRLRKEGINPEDYITVFCLRNWGKLPGNVLTSEMVYIHGKVCIVDDRLAIIGSANINERSQRGDRDSEIAAIIRDTDMIDGTMDGKPYKVGRFAHTLRVRLMREHIGVDVDAMYEEDLMSTEPSKEQQDQEVWDPDHEQHHGMKDGVTQAGKTHTRGRVSEAIDEIKDGARQALLGTENDAAKDTGYYLQKAGILPDHINATVDDKDLKEERQTYTRDGDKEPGFTSSIVPTIEEKTILENYHLQGKTNGITSVADNNDVVEDSGPPEARVHDGSQELYGAPANAMPGPQMDDQPPHARDAKNDPIADATEEEKAAVHARKIVRKQLEAGVSSPWTLPTPTPHVDPHGFEDPVCDAFWKHTWVACAVHNTEIFRKVFHCIPDDTVTTWKQYKEFILHHERMNKPVKDTSEPLGRVPSEAGDEDVPERGKNASLKADDIARQDTLRAKSSVRSNGTQHTRNSQSQMEGKSRTPTPEGSDGHKPSTGHGNGSALQDSEIRRAPSRADRPFEKWERDEMEKLLGELRGHLVLYPTRFLEGEDASNNFLFNADRLLPMPIYD